MRDTSAQGRRRTHEIGCTLSDHEFSEFERAALSRKVGKATLMREAVLEYARRINAEAAPQVEDPPAIEIDRDALAADILQRLLLMLGQNLTGGKK